MEKNKNILITILAIALFICVVYIFSKNNNQTEASNDKGNENYQTALYQQSNQNNDEISNSRRNIITETVKKVSPAVVGINVIEIQKYRDPFSSFFDDPFFRQFFGDRNAPSREIKELGSGYLISSDGYIITNDHVAGNASKITVTLTNGKNYDAKLIGTDQMTDIALVKIEGENFPYVVRQFG